MFWNFIFFITLLWALAITTADPWATPTKRNKQARKKKEMRNLLAWQVYTSDRFSITGNEGILLVVVDKREKLTYRVEFGDLVKFRTYWYRLDDDKRDNFIVAITMGMIGKSTKKDAA